MRVPRARTWCLTRYRELQKLRRLMAILSIYRAAVDLRGLNRARQRRRIFSSFKIAIFLMLHMNKNTCEILSYNKIVIFQKLSLERKSLRSFCEGSARQVSQSTDFIRVRTYMRKSEYYNLQRFLSF